MEQALAEDTLRVLSEVLTGRDNSFLDDSRALHRDVLEDRFGGRRVLVVGGAGFIATHTVRFLLKFRPSYVGLVDLSENSLAESIRSLRSWDLVPRETVIEPWLADVTDPLLERVLDSVKPVDQVLNFAAVKHVRTERDIPSLLRMLEVNVLGAYRLAKLVESVNPSTRQFVVSTDKAADPVNFMGASKRAMEIAALSADARITSARFANVAFSSGSLLESWLRRLSNSQPLAVPRDTLRYFMTPEESGHLCALASVATPGSILVPEFSESDLKNLTQCVHSVLQHFDLSLAEVESVDSGLAHIKSSRPGWPVIFTSRDTAGEKDAEVFLGSEEEAEHWSPGLRILPIGAETDAIISLLHDISEWTSRNSGVQIEDIHRSLAAAVPSFQHLDSTERLDDRM